MICLILPLRKGPQLSLFGGEAPDPPSRARRRSAPPAPAPRPAPPPAPIEPFTRSPVVAFQDHQFRPMVVVSAPNGQRTAFYRSTGTGGQSGKGDWIPFYGMGNLMGNAWLLKHPQSKTPDPYSLEGEMSAWLRAKDARGEIPAPEQVFDHGPARRTHDGTLRQIQARYDNMADLNTWLEAQGADLSPGDVHMVRRYSRTPGPGRMTLDDLMEHQGGMDLLRTTHGKDPMDLTLTQARAVVGPALTKQRDEAIERMRLRSHAPAATPPAAEPPAVPPPAPAPPPRRPAEAPTPGLTLLISADLASEWQSGEIDTLPSDADPDRLAFADAFAQKRPRGQGYVLPLTPAAVRYLADDNGPIHNSIDILENGGRDPGEPEEQQKQARVLRELNKLKAGLPALQDKAAGKLPPPPTAPERVKPDPELAARAHTAADANAEAHRASGGRPNSTRLMNVRSMALRVGSKAGTPADHRDLRATLDEVEAETAQLQAQHAAVHATPALPPPPAESKITDFDAFAKQHPATRIFQKYDHHQRADLAASHRLGHQQRQAVGEYFYIHPLQPGIAFPTRKRALAAAWRAYQADESPSPESTPPPSLEPEPVSPPPDPNQPPPGFTPITGSRKGGYHQPKPEGGYRYWYPGDGPEGREQLHPEEHRSPGHVVFDHAKGLEFFHDADGNLNRSPVSSETDVKGERLQGRFESAPRKDGHRQYLRDLYGLDLPDAPAPAATAPPEIQRLADLHHIGPLEEAEPGIWVGKGTKYARAGIWNALSADLDSPVTPVAGELGWNTPAAAVEALKRSRAANQRLQGQHAAHQRAVEVLRTGATLSAAQLRDLAHGQRSFTTTTATNLMRELGATDREARGLLGQMRIVGDTAGGAVLYEPASVAHAGQRLLARGGELRPPTPAPTPLPPPPTPALGKHAAALDRAIKAYQKDRDLLPEAFRPRDSGSFARDADDRATADAQARFALQRAQAGELADGDLQEHHRALKEAHEWTRSRQRRVLKDYFYNSDEPHPDAIGHALKTAGLHPDKPPPGLSNEDWERWDSGDQYDAVRAGYMAARRGARRNVQMPAHIPAMHREAFKAGHDLRKWHETLKATAHQELKKGALPVPPG